MNPMRPDYATRQKLMTQVVQLQGDLVNDATLKKAILQVVLDHYSGSRTGLLELQAIVDQLFASMRGLDVLEPLMKDPEITEIMVNGPFQVFIEKHGKISETGLAFDHAEHLSGVICRYFGQANRLINEKHPIEALRLPDGCRLHAVLPPVAPEGPALSIRKFSGVIPNLQALLDVGFLMKEQAVFLENAVKTRLNIFISGGTSSGKTTFLNALSGKIPAAERVITIEDAAELNLQGLVNWVRLESRPPSPEGKDEIALSDLIRAALRMRPDRIIVGEVRGREVFPMLQAMNTGHPGSMSTGHANSAQEMLNRLGLMVLLEVALPWDAVVRLISQALQLVVHLERGFDGTRYISQIMRIIPVNSGNSSGEFKLEPIYLASQAASNQMKGAKQ